MRQHEIQDPLDLHKLFRVYRSHDGIGWLFRGQADTAWPLVPKAGRPEYFNGRDLGRFHAWRQLAVAYAPLPQNDWECLAVAQHYGLATRLLDWSLNPLVATYFAVSEHFDRDGCVFCHFPTQFLKCDIFPLNGVTSETPCFIPRAIDERMNRQGGVFTVHCEPATPLACGLREAPLSGANLAKITIHKSAKRSTLEMLADYGVHAQGLFPDLDGLSRHINWRTSDALRRKNLRRIVDPVDPGP